VYWESRRCIGVRIATANLARFNDECHPRAELERVAFIDNNVGCWLKTQNPLNVPGHKVDGKGPITAARYPTSLPAAVANVVVSDIPIGNGHIDARVEEHRRPERVCKWRAGQAAARLPCQWFTTPKGCHDDGHTRGRQFRSDEMRLGTAHNDDVCGRLALQRDHLCDGVLAVCVYNDWQLTSGGPVIETVAARAGGENVAQGADLRRYRRQIRRCHDNISFLQDPPSKVGASDSLTRGRC